MHDDLSRMVTCPAKLPMHHDLSQNAKCTADIPLNDDFSQVQLLFNRMMNIIGNGIRVLDYYCIYYKALHALATYKL